MKTTENISLGGYAFTIETDAYDVLDTYLGEVRKAFSTDPSADEIIDDIEERIAELLKEQTVPGMVVSLAMITEIKKRRAVSAIMVISMLNGGTQCERR